jgi:signal transduction histidine kinase
MGRIALDPALDSRAAAALALLALAGSLVLGAPLAPATSARWVALLVLGLALADLLALAFDLVRGLWRGTAAIAALRGAARIGSIATGGFAAGWLVFRPAGADGIACFALLEAAALLTIWTSLQPWIRARRTSGPEARAASRLARRRARRLALAVGCSATVGATLVMVGWMSLNDAPARELACPLLPNGVVPASGILPPECPFLAFDRVVEVRVPGERGPFPGLAQLREKAERWPEFVEWTVLRGDQQLSAAVPVLEVGAMARVGRFTTALLLAAVMLTTALIVAWNTAAKAAPPFLVFYALVSVGLSAALCAGGNEHLRLVSALAVAVFPAALAHLGLDFPRDREGAARPTAVVFYSNGVLLVGLTLASFRGSAEVWSLLERMIPVFAFIAWGSMLLSGLRALRGPASALERARARIVLVGSAAVLAVALAIGALSGSRAPFTYRTGLHAVVLLPIPVAVALVRYHVFDLHQRLRRLLASLAYSALGSGVLTGLAFLAAGAQRSRPPLGDPGLLFSALFVLLLAADTLRGWFQGPGRELVSGAAHRRRTGAVRRVQELAELRDPDACARIIAAASVESLQASWAVVFLRSHDLGLRPAHAVGDGAPLSLDLALAADALAGSGDVLHLSRVRAGEPGERLVRAGVDVVMPLRGPAGTAGLVLLGQRQDAVPYTLGELDYLRTLAAQGGVALENARLARELSDAERSAARGNLAVGLAHELGKPLRVIEDIARSLDAGSGDPERVQRDLRRIAGISQELIGTVYGFVQEARGDRGRRGTVVADVVARAIHSVQHLHGANRISVSLARDLPEVAGGDELVTVLSNLLDNALLASHAEDSVRLFATADENELRLEVVDDGHGMDDQTAARAFELFFTTRSGQGGSGVGLALCREIVDHLGGRIELRSRPEKGTRVAVRLPRIDLADPAGNDR